MLFSNCTRNGTNAHTNNYNFKPLFRYIIKYRALFRLFRVVVGILSALVNNFRRIRKILLKIFLKQQQQIRKDINSFSQKCTGVTGPFFIH